VSSPGYPTVLLRALLLAFLAIGSAPVDADPKRGETAARLCLLCHRPDSSVPAPLLEAQPVRYLVEQIQAYRSGKRTDPSMNANVGSLKPREITDIADYFAIATPKRHGAAVDAEKARVGARRVMELGCEKCHMAGLTGRDAVPRLAGQLPSYLERQLRAFVAGNTRHPHTSWPAASADLEAVVHYLAGLQ
jgi:cytochrome c553